MTTILTSNLDRDGERRDFTAHGHAIFGSAGGLGLVRGVFEPGWRWSDDVAPVAGTPTCQMRHLGVVLSGRMHVVTEDGDEGEVGPGDLFDLGPGHDAWVVGDEPCVMLDYSADAARYAQPAATAPEADEAMQLVERGYAAFNAGDLETLRSLLAQDVTQQVPGTGPLSGAYKGADNVLNYYARLAELTDGTFRANLIETHSDGNGHVTAVHQITAQRHGRTRVSRGSILFTVVDGHAKDLHEMRADIAGDEAFLSD